MDRNHQHDHRSGDRPRRTPEREGPSGLEPGVRLRGASDDARHGLHERERERHLTGHRPAAVLLRLRTAANGPIARVYLSSTGILSVRSDVSGAQKSSGVALGTGWHGIQLCGTVGASGSWDLYRDGIKIVTGWVANTGTTPVGRVEIGDDGAKTFTINFDDVSVVGPSVAQPSGPNILIFLTDDQRASDTVIPSVMPKLRQWLMAGGREFTNFFDSTPLCCPDRSVILSGRYAHNTGVRTNTDFASLDQSLTMERLLDADGYETAYVGKFLNDWNISTKPPYFDQRSLVGGGYTDQTWNIDGVGNTYPDYTTDFAGQRANAYLDHFETNDQQPWAMFVATPAPHNPWTPAAKYANADVGVWAGNPATAETDRSDKPPWVQARNFSLAQAEAVRTPQLRTLKSVDDMVDTVMTRLQQLGELSDTLVIYTSDNGYLWGEHHLGGDYGLAAQKRYPYTDSVVCRSSCDGMDTSSPVRATQGSPRPSTSCRRCCRRQGSRPTTRSMATRCSRASRGRGSCSNTGWIRVTHRSPRGSRCERPPSSSWSTTTRTAPSRSASTTTYRTTRGSS